MKPFVDAVRFASEIALLIALTVVGIHVAWPLAIVLPVLAAVVWGRWIAPRAGSRLDDPARLTVEVVLFVGGGTALAVTASPILGVALIVVALAASIATRRG